MRTANGFTLIATLVVMSIVGTLAGLVRVPEILTAVLPEILAGPAREAGSDGQVPCDVVVPA